ncbi:hypothetical protein XalbCFBP2523_10840 [Xanthomonas albilineans]|nr:hypothetical protein XalbCFBP2523_10840 [Xanthomonas albilineans]
MGNGILGAMVPPVNVHKDTVGMNMVIEPMHGVSARRRVGSCFGLLASNGGVRYAAEPCRTSPHIRDRG